MATKQKTILLGFSGSFRGGAEHLMIELISTLEKAGFDISIILNNQGVVSEELKKVGFNPAKIKIKKFLNKVWPFPYAFNLLSFIKTLKKVKPDLVILEGKQLTQVGTIACNLLGIPIASYVHFPPSKYEVKRMFYHRTQCIIVCCEGIQKYFSINENIEAAKIVPIPNYVDTSIYSPEPSNTKLREDLFGVKSNDIVVTLVGHLSKVKGQRYLIESVSSLRKIGIPIVGVLVGEDNSPSKTNEKYLRQLVKDSALESSIVFMGKCKNINKILCQSDIFVLPSKKEGLPLVLLEAMACGTPSIASNVDGNADAIIHGESGVLIEASNSEALEREIRRLIEDKNFANKISEAALQRVTSKFSKKAYESSITKLAHDLIEQT